VLWRQRVEFLREQGRLAEAGRWQERAAAAVPETTRDLGLLAWEHAFRGEFLEALPLLQRAVRLDPRDFRGWFDLGLCQKQLGHDVQAEACFGTCIALAPDFALLYYRRGLVSLRLGQFGPARDDFDRVARDRPDMAEAYLNRALASLGLGRKAEALADLSRAAEGDTPYTRVYLIRAQVRADLGDAEGARRDWEEGLRRRPCDEQSFLARGHARLGPDPRGALADFDEALQLNPRSRPALSNKAHVLAERLAQLPEALAVLEQLLQLDPGDVAARASRAVLLARRGLRDEAQREAEACLARDARPATLYQLAGAYALTAQSHPDDGRRALQLLELALRQGYGLDLIDRDPDLKPLREQPAFQLLVETFRRRREG
jgi:tetratricopeptide (TPR) repeat protein